MGNLLFWNEWNKTERWFYFSSLILFLLSLIYFIFSFVIGYDAVIHWVIVSKNTTISILNKGVELGAISLNYNVDNILIAENYEGSDLEVNIAASYIFLAFNTIATILFLTIITGLKRTWFVVGVVLFLALLINFKLDQLLVFGSYQNIPLYIMIGLYLPILYYFHAFATHINMFVRFIVFALLTIITGSIFIQFAQVANPLLYLSNYGVLFPVIISIMFIFTVAFEVIAGLLYLVTNHNSFRSSNSLLHFTLITLIYLVNVALVYAKNRQFIDWDFYYIDEFVLLIFSALIGIYGFRHRNTFFSSYMSFDKQGGFLYLLCGVICFSTIAYIFGTGNDPLIETMEDSIIFSHLGFGFIFYLYILINFMGPLNQNLQVYKVMYKPTRMPYFVMRFAGLIMVGMFFFQSGQLALNQAVAGYYNGIGDLYAAVDDEYVAEQYYKLAGNFEYQNHRSNYALASLANKQGKPADALVYYQQSILKKPTPYAYANLAGLYEANGMFFDAVFSLQEGIENFPNDPYLHNNLGILYGKTDVLDSAIMFLDIGMQFNATEEVSRANLLSLLTDRKYRNLIDSLTREYDNESYLPVLNNLLVLNNINGQTPADLFKPGFLADSLLNPNTYAFLVNGLINGQYHMDTTLTVLANNRSKVAANINYEEGISFAGALYDYSHGEVLRAFKTIDRLQLQNTTYAGYYNNVNGIWAMQQNDPVLANYFFNRSWQSGFTDALMNQGIALVEMNQLDSAKTVLQEVHDTQSGAGSQVVKSMLKIITSDSLDFQTLTDQERLLWLQINFYEETPDRIEYAYNQIQGDYYKDLFQLELARLLMKQHRLDEVEVILQEMETRRYADPTLFEKLVELQHQWLVEQDQVNLSEQALEEVKKSNPLIGHYLMARLAEQQQDSVKAEKYYRFVANKNPFQEKIIIDAARFFYEQVNDENLAYETILNSLIINPNSVRLSKAFILQSIEMGLVAYAEEELEHLSTITSGEDFALFKRQADQLIIDKDNEHWE